MDQQDVFRVLDQVWEQNEDEFMSWMELKGFVR